MNNVHERGSPCFRPAFTSMPSPSVPLTRSCTEVLLYIAPTIRRKQSGMPNAFSVSCRNGHCTRSYAFELSSMNASPPASVSSFSQNRMISVTRSMFSRMCRELWNAICESPTICFSTKARRCAIARPNMRYVAAVSVIGLYMLGSARSPLFLYSIATTDSRIVAGISPFSYTSRKREQRCASSPSSSRNA